MGLRFRETYGLLRFGARDPARHQSHGSLVPWPDSVPTRLPHFGVDLRRKKQKFNMCSPMSCGSEFSMVPTADGSQRTKLVAPHFLRLGTQQPYGTPMSLHPALDGKGGSVMENCLQTITA